MITNNIVKGICVGGIWVEVGSCLLRDTRNENSTTTKYTQIGIVREREKMKFILFKVVKNTHVQLGIIIM